MSDKDDADQLREAIAKGIGKDEPDISNALLALKQSPINYFGLIQESITFLKQLATTETPSDPEIIKQFDKKEIRFATYRANFFEKIRMPVFDDEQLEYLLIRTHELWGEYPSEPVGRWVDWCLWTHLQRRRTGVPITEVIAGNKTADDLKQSWIDRHQAREDRRRLQKIDNYERYDKPGDVPASVQQLVMSPFIEKEEWADVEVVADESTQDATQN